MTKNYVLQGISAGSCFGWQIISHSSHSINVELKGKSGRLYFSEAVSGNCVRMPSSQGADICNDTELSINSDMLNTLKNSLGTTSNLNLVAAGSCYYGSYGSAYKNISTIYAKIDDGWKAITKYTKLIPFTMGYSEKIADFYKFDKSKYPLTEYKLLVEDIEMDDNITLLPYKDCIVGVAICRDVMDLLDSHNPLHKYCDFVDVMLVISDNSGDSNMFVGTAECLARWHNCATVYTNSIHEAGTGNPDSHLEISFALYPYKKHGDELYIGKWRNRLCGKPV